MHAISLIIPPRTGNVLFMQYETSHTPSTVTIPILSSLWTLLFSHQEHAT